MYSTISKTMERPWVRAPVEPQFFMCYTDRDNKMCIDKNWWQWVSKSSRDKYEHTSYILVTFKWLLNHYYISLTVVRVLFTQGINIPFISVSFHQLYFSLLAYLYLELDWVYFQCQYLWQLISSRKVTHTNSRKKPLVMFLPELQLVPVMNTHLSVSIFIHLLFCLFSWKPFFSMCCAEVKVVKFIVYADKEGLICYKKICSILFYLSLACFCLNTWKSNRFYNSLTTFCVKRSHLQPLQGIHQARYAWPCIFSRKNTKRFTGYASVLFVQLVTLFFVNNFVF